VAAAEWLAESLQDRTTITIEIDLAGSDGMRQPGAVERAAYRVLQLALDNVIRHSGAATAFVHIQSRAHSLTLSVADEGEGVAHDSLVRAASAGHLGIADMRAEADSVGASLTIERRSPQGTTVTLKWHG
jgi:signal transduction histidine kinase